MEANFMLEDIDEAWIKLGKEAYEAGTKVATIYNMDAVNAALEVQSGLLSELQLHIKTELGMHAVACVIVWILDFLCLEIVSVSLMTKLSCAAKSSLGWKVVGFMELDPELDKAMHGMDISKLRAKEKAMMQHDLSSRLVYSLANLSHLTAGYLFAVQGTCRQPAEAMVAVRLVAGGTGGHRPSSSLGLGPASTRRPRARVARTTWPPPHVSIV